MDSFIVWIPTRITKILTTCGIQITCLGKFGMTSNFWKNQQVFVTGCTGLLDSWLCSSLIERGADVVGLVRDSLSR